MNMQQIIQNIQIIWNVKKTLEPFVNDLVAKAESLLPAGSNGAQKFAMVKTELNTIATVAGIVEADFVLVWPVIAAMIETAVAAFNLSNGWTQAIAGINTVVGILNASPVPAPAALAPSVSAASAAAPAPAVA